MRLKQISGFTIIIFLLSVPLNRIFLQQQQVKQTTLKSKSTFVNSCGIMVNAGPDITICAGIGKSLNGNVIASTDYSWDPPNGLSNPNILKPLATPSATTTYTLIAKAMSGNLIVNGNFETGSIAPATSQYTPYNNLNTFVLSSGGYMVLSIPQIAMQFGCNPNVGNYSLFITGTGSGTNIWCQTINVNPNTDYKIEYKVIGVPYIFGPGPTIGMKANGTLVGSIDAPNGLCIEADASFIWNSGAATSANFCLANYGGTGQFAICGIDDITIKECCVEKDEVVVTVYDLIADAAPPDEINCLNKPITIDASASSQGTGITYDWSTKNGHIVSGSKTLKPVVDTPGTYTLKIVGLYGCETELMVIVNGSVKKPDVSIKSIDIDCLNPTGSIDASSKSNSPQFEWNGPNGFYSTKAKNLNLKEAGEYIVKVTDSYGCESTAKVEIKDNRNDLEAEIVGDSISCAKDSAILKASSIAHKPIYNWKGPFNYKKDSSNYAVVKDTGWYFLGTTDSAGCKELDSFYVKDLASSIPVSITADTIKCNQPQVTLKLQVDTSGTIQWKGPKGFSSNKVQPVVSDTGWYYVDVQTKDGCTGIDSIFVYQNDKLPDIFAFDDTLYCNQKLTLNGGSGTPAVHFEWKAPNGFKYFTAKPVVTDTGNYLFKVIDVNGCEATKLINISGIDDTPVVQIIKSKDKLTCIDSLINVELKITRTYKNILWNLPNGKQDTSYKLNINSSGTYLIFVTSEHACVFSDSFKVLDFRNSFDFNIESDSISCKHKQATLKLTSNQSNLSIQWSGPNNFTSTLQNPTVLIGGNYSVTVTDTNGCQLTKMIAVSADTSKIALTISTDTIKCSSPDVILKLQADTSSTFDWKGPNGFHSNQYQPKVSESGWYYVDVQTKEGCKGIDSIFVEKSTDIPDIYISTSDTITCDKNSINVSGGSNSPGTIIEWMTPIGLILNQSMFQAIDSGKYVLTVTGPNGCKISKSVQIFKDVTIPFISGYNDTLNCQNDSLQLVVNVNNARSYFWSGPNNFGSNLVSPVIKEKGIYHLTVTALNGCQSNTVINISEDKSLPNLHIQPDTINCIRTSIIPIVNTDSTAISFSWSGPNGFSSQLKNPSISIGGNYSMTIRGKNGCDSTQTISIVEDVQKPTASLQADTIQCKSIANISANNISPGANIQWKGPKGFLSNLSKTSVTESGFYTLLVTAMNGCVFEDSIFVFQKDILPDIFAFDDTLSCAHPKLFLNGGSNTPGVKFEWTGPNGFTSNLPGPEIQDSGIYTLKVTDPNGCEASRQILIIKNSGIPVISIQKSNNNITCIDSLVFIKLNANQAAKNILWSGPNGFQSNQDQFSINIPGKYLVEFTNNFGCITKDSFTIQDLRSIPDLNVSDDSITCIRTKVTLKVSSTDNNLIFQWSGPNNYTSATKNPIIQFGGIFKVIAIDTTNNCQITKSIFIQADTAKPDLTILADTLSCLRSSAPVKAGTNLQQGFTMKWTGPNGFTYTLPQFATTIPGRYFCTITNFSTGCSNSSFVDVVEDTARIRSVIAQTKNASCNSNNGKISITQIDGGKQPFKYSIDNGINFTNDISSLNLAPGNFTVLVEDANGCRYTVSVIIDEDKSIDIGLPNLIQIKQGTQSQLHLNILSDTSNIVSILWSPSDQLSCNDCTNPILTATHDELILVTVIDKNGCADTASIQVQILKESNFYFPNTFSPNGDNINDYFYPIGLSQSAKVSYLNIYDRWGNLVFQKKEFQPGIEREGWDGRSIDQKRVNPGVYIFVSEIIDQGITYKYSGDLTLIQ